MVYDDTEESSALEEEFGGGEAGGGSGRGGGVMARVMSLERRGVRMVDNSSIRQGADSQSGGMFSSNKETVRKLVEDEFRGKVPRNKSFKQAVGAGIGGGGGNRIGGGGQVRRRKSLEEQLVRNTEVRPMKKFEPSCSPFLRRWQGGLPA